MTAILDSELVTIVSVDGNDFTVKISYITADGILKVKQKTVDWTRELTIASGVTL